MYALLRRHALRPLGGAGAAEQQGEAQQGKQGQQEQGQQPSSSSHAEAANGSSQAAAEPQAMQCGSLAYLEDPRNEDVLVGMRDGVTGEAEAGRRPRVMWLAALVWLISQRAIGLVTRP